MDGAPIVNGVERAGPFYPSLVFRVRPVLRLRFAHKDAPCLVDRLTLKFGNRPSHPPSLSGGYGKSNMPTIIPRDNMPDDASSCNAGLAGYRRQERAASSKAKEADAG